MAGSIHTGVCEANTMIRYSHLKKIFITWLCVSASSLVSAAENYWYLCQHQDAERRIVVEFKKPPASAPCAVHYIKAESQQTLWTADNQEDYCGPKADAFAEKQQSWGWQCFRRDGKPNKKSQ